MKKLLLTACLLFSANAFAASTNKYWIGGAGDNFTDDTKWSTTSGGTNDTTTPGATDIANFDGGGNTNCNFSAAVSVAGFKILSGYTQTITQSTYDLTVGADNFSEADGAFTGGSGAITINGTWTLSGGVFTSTSTTLQVSGNVSQSGGTFTHHSGILDLSSSSSQTLAMTSNVYELRLIKDADTDTVTLTANLSSANIINVMTGTLILDGFDVACTNAFTIGSSCFLKLKGTEASVKTPTLYGTVTYTGDNVSNTKTCKNWTYDKLTINDANANKSTFKFGETHTSISTFTLTDGTFSQSAGDYAITCVDFTQTGGTFTGGTAALTVTHYFSLSTGAFTSTSGTLTVQNDFTRTSGTFTHNSGTVDFTGTGATVNCTDSFYTITVNKSGQLLMGANLTAANTFTLTTGTLHTYGFNLTVTSTFTVATGTMLRLFGTETISTPTLASGSTVEYRGDNVSNTKTCQNWTYKNLTINDTYTNKSTFKFGETHTGIETFTVTLGTFSQSAGDYAITCTGYTQTGGTFTGGTAALTVNGAFALSTGTFTSTSGTLTVQGNFTRTSGTFTHNSGTVDFTSGVATVTCTDSFRNITVNKTAEATLLNLGSNLTATNTITVTTGTLVLAGYDVACTNAFTITAGSFLRLKGTEASVKIPTLAATSTVTYVGDNVASTKTCQNWTYSSITINDANANKSTFKFGETHTSIATFTLTDGTFSQAGGDYAITCTDYSQTGGTWDGGSATFSVNGTWTLNGGEFQCGTGIILAKKNWTYTSGTVTPETSTVKFGDAAYSPGIVTGTHTLNNVVIWSGGGPGGNKVTIATGTTVTANGTLDILPGLAWMKIEGGGTIAAKGNITFNEYNVLYDSTRPTLLINGTTAQTLTGASAGTNHMNVTINKSDTLNLAGTLTFGASTGGPTWTYTAGTIAPGTSTINFTCCTVTGTHTLGNVGISAYAAVVFTISAGTTLTTTGTCTIGQTGTWGALNGPGVLDCQGNVSIPTDVVLGGTMVFQMTGTAAQSLTSAITGTNWRINPFTINKASGVVTMMSNLVLDNTGQDLAVTSGTLYLNGYALTVNDSFVVSSAGILQLKGGTDSTSKAPTLNNGSTVTYVGDNTGGSYTCKNWSYKNLFINDQNVTPCTFKFSETHTGITTFAISGGTFSQAAGDYAISCTTYSQTGGTFTGGTATFTTSGTTTISGGVMTAPTTWNAYNDWQLTAGTFNNNSGTLTLLTNANTLRLASGTFNNLIVNGQFLTLAITGTVNTVNLTLTAIRDFDGGTLRVSGNIVSTDAAMASTTGTLEWAGAGSSSMSASGGTGVLPNVLISGVGTLTISDTLNLNGTNVTWTQTGGTVTGTGTIGCVSWTIYTFSGATIPNLIVSITGGTAALGTMTIPGNLTLTSAGSLTGAVTLGGNITCTDTAYTTNTLAVTMNGVGTQNIDTTAGVGVFPGGTFTINKAGGTAILTNGALSVNVTGQDLTVTSGTFDLNGYNLTVNDALTIDTGGTLQLKNSETINKTPVLNTGSTVAYKGTGAASSQTARNWTYKNLSFLETSGTPDTFKFGETHTGITALTIANNGIFSQAAGDYAITASIYTQTGGTFTGGTAAFTVNGNWDQAVGAFTSTSGTFTCTGNLTHTSGTFTHNNGTVALTGGSQQVTGNTTFYTLTKSGPGTTLTFGAGNTLTVANSLSLQGTVANYMNLRSTTPGTFAQIVVPATRTLRFLDFADIKNSGTASFHVQECRRSGKTYGIIFPGF